MTFRKHSDKPETVAAKVIYSCCAGDVVPLESVSCELFPSMFIGDGFCITASDNRFVCPAKGVVKDVSESGADITIKTSDGLILIVSLGRDGNETISPTVCVKRGDNVCVGTRLWETDIDDGTLVTAVVVTNCGGKAQDIKYGTIKQPGQPVMSIII